MGEIQFTNVKIRSFFKIKTANIENLNFKFSELQTDSDGRITCPVCEQKFSQDANWETHLEEERRSLISSIEK